MLELNLVFVFALSLAVCLAMMPLLIKYSAKLRLIDDPSESDRKLHQDAMPRSGGLGIILAAGAALLVMLPPDAETFSFLSASLVIVAFGLLDDFFELTPLQKMGGQALGVVVAMLGGMVITELPFIGVAPDWFTYPLTFFFVLGVINGVNFSDGMDGLAAGLALMSLVLLFSIATETGNVRVAYVAMAISAALVGFLRFNTHPARIFMGDAGSQFLGFSLAWLCISVSQDVESPITALLPLVVLGLPVLDIAQVIPVRIHKKLPLPGPDKEHLHHQIAKLGYYHYEVVATIYVLQSILLLGAFFLRYSPDVEVLCFFLAYGFVLLGSLYGAHRIAWRVRDTFDENANRRNRFFRRLSFLHPYSGKFYGICVSLILIAASLSSGAMQAPLIYLGMFTGAILFVARVSCGTGWPLFLSRLATYSAAVFAAYGIGISISDPDINFAINSALVVLSICLAVSMRTTRKEYFWLTPQDLLMLLFVLLLAPSVPIDLGASLNEGVMIFRTLVLLYACEYIIARGDQAQRRISTAAVASLILLGVNI